MIIIQLSAGVLILPILLSAQTTQRAQSTQQQLVASSLHVLTESNSQLMK
jgi:hypothetical protein